MSNPYGGPPGPQQPYGPNSGPQPQQPYGPPSGPQPQQPYPGSYPQAPYGVPSMHPAGRLAEWGPRALGYLIDAGIPFVAVWVLYLIAFLAMGGLAAAAGNGDPTGLIIVGVVLGVIYLAILVFSLWNTTYRRGKTGQTLGQQVAKIKTVGEQTGQPIGFGRAFLRQIVHIVDSIICGLPIGWLSPLWDDKKQTWADKIMGTLVVHVEEPNPYSPGNPVGGAGYPAQPPQGGFPPPQQPGGYPPPPPGQPPFGQPPRP